MWGDRSATSWTEVVKSYWFVHLLCWLFFLVAVWLHNLHQHQCITAIVKMFFNEFVFYPPTFIQEVTGTLTTALFLFINSLNKKRKLILDNPDSLDCSVLWDTLPACRVEKWQAIQLNFDTNYPAKLSQTGNRLKRPFASPSHDLCVPFHVLPVTFVALWLHPYHNNCQSVFSALVWLHPTKIFTELMWVPLFEGWWEKDLAHEPMNKLPKS